MHLYLKQNDMLFNHKHNHVMKKQITVNMAEHAQY